MKKFSVTKAVWANYADMDRPFWRFWNRAHRLPQGFWQRVWEYPFVLLHVPKDEPSLDVGGTYPFVLFENFPKAVSLDIRDLNTLDHPLHKGLWPKEKLIIGDAMHMPVKDNAFRYSFSISAIEEMPDPVAVLKEMVRVTSERIVVTMDISNVLGVNDVKLAAVLEYLGIDLPAFPSRVMRSDDSLQKRYGQKPLKEFSDIRVLGIVIDKDEMPKECAILIPHSESFDFLRLCMDRIKACANPEVRQHVYILDDNSQDGSFQKIQQAWGNDRDVTIKQIVRANFGVPDVGQVLDEGLKLVQERFVAMIDADVFPMSKDWLLYPIWLLETQGASSVGTDTCLSLGYVKKLPESWKNKDGYLPGFDGFSNEYFTCTNNFYRVARTADAKVVSGFVGYRRAHHWLNRFLDKTVNKLIGRLAWLYVGFPEADNGVQANYFIDANALGKKWSIPILNFLGFTPNDGVFGQNVCGLIMHFALSTRALETSHKEIADSGTDYKKYVKDLFSDRTALDRYIREVSMDNHVRIKALPTYPWYVEQYEKFRTSFSEYEKRFRA